MFLYVAKVDLSSISRSRRENGRTINCSKFHFYLCVKRIFHEKKAMSNWPIGKQTDNPAAFDGQQSSLLSVPFFSDAIVSPRFRSKRGHSLLHCYITIIVWFHHSISIKNVCDSSKKWRINTTRLVDTELSLLQNCVFKNQYLWYIRLCQY